MIEKIRPFEKKDIDQIVKIIEEHHTEDEYKWISLNSEGYYWMLAYLFKDYCFVAERGNTIVGFIHSIPHQNKVYLEDILVKKIKRREKIGTLLLQALEKNIIEKHDEIWLTVNPENDISKKFFESNNYISEGIVQNLKGKGAHRQIFRKPL